MQTVASSGNLAWDDYAENVLTKLEEKNSRFF